MKIFIYTTLDEAIQNELRKKLPANSEIFFRHSIPINEIKQVFKSAEIIMGNPPPTWFINPLPSLKFWQIDSAGFDQYQHIKLDIPIANLGDFFAHECAETIVGGLLAFYRKIDQLNQFQTNKEWKGQQIRLTMQSLRDKRVLILGSGTIGLAIKKILTGFGCQIKTTAQNNPIADFRSLNAILQYLPQTNLVINTLPGTADNYVSKSFIDAMSVGSVYASVGRGNTTDEEALITALQSKKLAGAVLDVTEKEPLPPDSPLWEMENVILTQHTAGGSENENKGRVELFISNFYNFINDKKIDNQVKLTFGY